jgi:hypothetical protein
MGKSSQEFMRQREREFNNPYLVSSKTQMDELFSYFGEIFSPKKTQKDEETNF